MVKGAIKKLFVITIFIINIINCKQLVIIIHIENPPNLSTFSCNKQHLPMMYICIFPLTNLFNFNNILYYKCIYFLNNKYINQSSIHRIPPDIKIDLSFPQSVSSRDYFLTPFLMTLVKKYIIAYSS